MLVKYLSLPFEEIRVEEDREALLIIEKYFCKHDKAILETLKVFATIANDLDLKELLELIKHVLGRKDITIKPVRFRGQAKR